MRHTSAHWMLLLPLLFGAGLASYVAACPFCSSVSQTFSEEIASMQVAVLAELVDAPDVPESTATDPDAPLPKAKFRITQVVKGEDFASVGDEIEVLYFGEAEKERPHLIMGTDAPNVMWSTPLGLSDRARDYVLALGDLKDDASRLEFFQEYLEDKDEMLARDAYDEFAKTPYEGVIALKDKMHHDRLKEWIQDRDVPASRRRLYFTMLGVCGVEETDAPLLRTMIRSDDRRTKAGLDAMIACYLILTREAGMEEIEDLFLKNKDAEYADTYAAIMAIRFHGNDTDVIPKQRLILALRHLLERPELADLVIPDLARWKDWEVMPRMVQLFKEADEKSSWVRVPVVNYLRSCPLPEAKRHIEQLSKVDADAVKRAETFFPFDAEGDGGAAAEAEKNGKVEAGSSSSMRTPKDANVDTVVQAEQPAPQAVAVRSPPNAETNRQVSTLATQTLATSQSSRPAALSLRDSQRTVGPDAPGNEPVEVNRGVIWGVPIVLGFALMFVYKAILGVPFWNKS